MFFRTRPIYPYLILCLVLSIVYAAPLKTTGDRRLDSGALTTLSGDSLGGASHLETRDDDMYTGPPLIYHVWFTEAAAQYSRLRLTAERAEVQGGGLENIETVCRSHASQALRKFIADVNMIIELILQILDNLHKRPTWISCLVSLE
ncbi:hypothetical protein DFJ43DRAFT_533136 [Lentinula guzmanii]|uniref:Uncharacterized protein n=1 Tax=Lentinula guzmanii TaxID=2804957 RepID=A0AA38JCE8_9AGAR|nr:hypothetical protein DFJ43DRAFT_533136 [Lentinula guzmanii]